MTYKERYLLDHPEISEEKFVGSMGCPHGSGYELSTACTEMENCEQCWGRKIPDKSKEIEEMFARELEEADKSHDETVKRDNEIMKMIEEAKK